MTRSLRSIRRGSNAVEFAIALPLLATLFAGVVDVGRYLSIADAVVAAASEGAQTGAVTDETPTQSPAVLASAMSTRVWNAAGVGENLSVVVVLSGTAPNQQIAVTGTAPFSPFFGFLKLPTTITYRHTLRMMYQP